VAVIHDGTISFPEFVVWQHVKTKYFLVFIVVQNLVRIDVVNSFNNMQVFNYI